MEADGFVSRRRSVETPGVDSRVAGAAAGAEFRWLGGRLLEATGGFVGSLSSRMPGEQDFAPVLHRATPTETPTSAEPDIDYEGLPQGEATSTHMLAGAVAGIMEHCLMYPIDCVKTRMQSLHPEPGARYRNVMDALRQIVRTEGVWRPIRGVNVLAVGAGPAHALYFACYEKIKFSLSDAIHPGANSHFANGVAGCMATVLHDAMMNPAEVVKQRMQMFNSPYRSVLDCMGSLLRREGPAAFYRSYTTQLTMNVPFQALHFMTYEYLQELLNPHRQYNPSSHVVSGALAGAVAAAVTTPLDVCKTLLNTQEAQAIHVIQADAATAAGAVGAAAATAPGSRHISGLGEAFRTVYRMGGMPAFFKGVQARVIYQMPSTAISWSVYEFFKYIITKRQHERRLRGDRDGDK
ncbi:mitoferrin-2-like isoform X1 [Paralichthys olivaceus]|uniref:mitoferrin-2-like isoform X1 n=2 Tax=Paralichthys olivaceus TaxID=8255 RepID=UPI00097D51A8|nr:PREDICTED: mitoferrin-2-like [Paralichthys olivaceus]